MSRFALLAVVAVLSTGLSLPKLRAADQTREELVRNPGFDEDANGDELPDGWSVLRDRVLWREKVYLSRDYELVSKPQAYVLATQDLHLKPGARYTLTLTMKGDGGAMGGALLLHGPQKPTREMPLMWRVKPSQEYEKYVGTFTAPEGATRLYLYNTAREGTIYYDRVSIYEGEPSDAVIGPVNWRPLDQPIGEPLATPHIDWASPLPQGPIKTFITLRAYRCLRDVIELGQRIDLDYDLVETGYEGQDCLSETNRRAMKRMDANEYQVYLVPSRIPPALVKSIRQRVEAGAGLVVVEGFGQASKFTDLKTLQTVDDEHFLRSGIPWQRMPEKILSAVQIGRLGEGRVVRLVFPSDVGRVWGLLPSENSMDAYKARQFEYWEWWHSLLAKALVWAAGREGDVRLQAVAADARRIELAASGAPAGARAQVVVRSAREIRFDGPLLRREPQDISLQADGRLTVPLGEKLPAGPVLADVTLRDAQGKVLAWGSFVAEIPQAARIVELKTDQETYRPDSQIGLRVRLTGEKACNIDVAMKLIDAFGRVVAARVEHVQVGPGEQAWSGSLPIGKPLCVHHRAEVRLLAAGHEQDRAWTDVLVSEIGPQRAADDFLATTWSPGMTHPVILAQYTALERAVGLNSQFGSSLYAMSEHGTPCAGYIGGTGGAFRCEKYSGTGIRPRCLSDAKVVEAFTTAAEESARNQRTFGPFAVGIADEAFLASRHRRDEMCFCAHCEARYRRWLQQQYPTIQALNAQWGTAFTAWDEVRGAKTEDVRGKENFSPFVDFRTFMTDVWVEACKAETDAYHRGAPEVPVGHTNTFGAEPFCGNDYWKLCTRVGFGWGQEYSEAIKAQGQKAVFELWRSFVETPQARRSRAAGGSPDAARPFFNYGWIGYSHTEAAAHYEPWWLALHGSRGVSYYATNSLDASRRVSWALVHPTMNLTGYSRAVQETLRDLRAGCGKLLLEYEREKPQAALLWSYPSMLVSWCESQADQVEPNEQPGTDSYGTYFKSALNFRQHLDELQLDYVYLAPEQILDGPALNEHRLLFLPFTVAASPAIVDRLQAYVQAGGVLVGDLRCLRTDEHGKPLAKDGGLKRLFGVERGDGGVDYGRTTVTFSAAGSDIDLRGQAVELHGREPLTAAGATSLAAHAGGEPAVLVRPLGKGLTVYLNFALPEYDLVTRELVRQLTARARIARPVLAKAATGDAPPKAYERNTFTRGPISVHGFIRDHRRAKDSDPVQVAFEKPAHVYDVRAGKYLGHTASVQATLAPGDTALYACLPYEVRGMQIAGPQQIVAGQELRLQMVVQAEGQTWGDHVFHLELLSPDGTTVWHYTQNVLAPGGKKEICIPLAWNEAPGRWTAKVRDVLSGKVAETVFEVTVR